MKELKPCPFCGSKAEYVTTISGDVSVGCTNEICGCTMSIMGWDDDVSRKLLADEWNTRYEPTCTMDTSLKGMGMLGCSNCGMTTLTLDTMPKYCQHCGAKVINECTMNRVYLYDEEAVEGIECSECGWGEIHDHKDPLPDTCPSCKAKVIEE